MPEKYSESEQKWKIDVVNSPKRDYSFKSGSGEDVDLLYYPDSDENEYSEKTKIEPILEDNNESEEVNEKSYSEEFNSEEEIEELSDEDINQENEEELLDIPTFLRRQAN